MVNDIYAIMESYSRVAEGNALPGVVGLRASINNTERQSLLSTGVKAPNNYTPGGPVAGESDESTSKIKKEISAVVARLAAQAVEGNYGKMVLDCKALKDLLDQVHSIKK